MSSLREFLRQEQLAEQSAQAARDRHNDELAAELAGTHGQVLKLQRDRVLTARDDEFILAEIDPQMVTVKMSRSEAAEFNGVSAEAFSMNEPRYKPCSESEDQMLAYAERNGLQVVSAPMWQAIFNRLLDLNLIEERQPESEPLPIELEQDQPPQDSEPDYEVGIDPKTQEARRYTQRQIAAMSANEYRLTFGLVTVNRAGEPSR